MGFATSPLSYADVRGVLDKALAAPKGIQIDCGTYGHAVQLRARLNKAREIDRHTNAKTYPDDHPMHGLSHYDSLRISLPRKGTPGDATLTIVKVTADTIEVKEIA